MRRALSALLLLAPLACERSAPPAPAPPAPAPKPAAPAPPKKPVTWTWRPLGNLAVIEGEIPEAGEVVLEGPSTLQRTKAGAGRFRWEIIRPPEGERAELRMASGKVLARFRFETPKATPGPEAPAGEPAPGEAVEAPEAKAGPEGSESAKPPAPPKEIPKEATPLASFESSLRGPLGLPESLPGRPQFGFPEVPPAPRAKIQPPPLPALRPPLPGGAWPGAGEALHLARGPRNGKRLVLSFDGGSSAEVAGEILDTLRARQVRTTMFLTGAFVQRYPDLVKRMAREGHELGNHTMNHPHFAPGGRRDPRWTRERFQRELLEADQALYALLGRPMDPFWRAPYGEQTPEIREWAEQLGYRHVGWSEGADTLDWATASDRKLYRSGTAILERLHRRLAKDGEGMIVLMHLGSARPQEDRPAKSLGGFMDRAAKEGWRFVPVGAFLRDLGKPEWNPLRRVAMLRGSPFPQGAHQP
ncbi:MAG: polysaccharide deacetylase family protein [Acidobacteria bacterium]|nr:polysaccharide deacetylase family protein [Acidobacteriota bacterium]